MRQKEGVGGGRQRGGGRRTKGGGVWRTTRSVTGGGGRRSTQRASRGGGSLVCGPRLESVGRPGKKGNGLSRRRIVPSSIYSNISKRLELI
jgi:hypothetical protein